MSTDAAFALVIALGAVCGLVVTVGGIFDLIVTAYAARRLQNEASLQRAQRWLGVSFRLSNPAFVGVYGSIAIAYVAYDRELVDLLSGRAWALALTGVVLLGIGLGQAALARYVNSWVGGRGGRGHD